MDISSPYSYLGWAPVFGLVGYGMRKLLTPKAIGDIPHNSLAIAVGDFPALLDSVKRGVGVGTWISEQSRIHGPIMSLHMGPFLTKVIVTDPHEVEDILTRRVAEFAFSDTQRAVFGGVMPYGMLSLPRDGMWMAHRRALNPSMGKQYLQKCTSRINAVSRQLGAVLQLRAAMMPKGSCLDISDDLQLYTMDSVAAFSFGEAFGGMDAALQALVASDGKDMSYNADTGLVHFKQPDVPMHDAVRVLFEVMGEVALSPFPNLTVMLCRRRQTWKKAHKLFFDYLDAKISQAREDCAGGGEFDKNTVPEIAFATEGRHGSFPDSELKDEMLNFLLAGQDTTAAALQWGLKLLSHHPAVQIKLKDHLEKHGLFALENENLKYEDVRTEKVPYLEAVILEILRFSQIALFVSRMTSCDTQVLGHFIPKGTEIVLHIGHAGLQNAEGNWVQQSVSSNESKPARRMSVHKPLWKGDGDAFNPDRWLDEYGAFNSNSGLAIPFGAGPRKCFGYKLAMLQLKLAMIELSRRFYFEPPSNPELDSWKVKETVNRVPLQNYIVMRPWQDVDC